MRFDVMSCHAESRDATLCHVTCSHAMTLSFVGIEWDLNVNMKNAHPVICNCFSPVRWPVFCGRHAAGSGRGLPTVTGHELKELRGVTADAGAVGLGAQAGWWRAPAVLQWR